MIRNAAALALMLFTTLVPTLTHAMCLDGTSATCFVNGCAGERECNRGHWTGCIVDSPGNCPPPPPAGNDTVTENNAPATTQVGILVDGRRATGAEVDDRSFVLSSTGTSVTFNVGDLISSALGNEVIAFASGRAPTLGPTPWTPATDHMSNTLVDTLHVPITIWVVTAASSFNVQSLQAFSAAIQAAALYDQERVGLDWNQIEVRNETANTNAATFMNVTGANFGQLATLIGRVAGRINIYWVPAVNGGSGNGLGLVANGDMVAVGQNAAPGLLAHEIGHNLALDHVDGDARFDGTNVMTSNGGTRQFLTEGQAFRAHIRSISAIRSAQVYALRAGMPIRDNCDITTTDRLCPKADKRIWADGAAFPPN